MPMVLKLKLLHRLVSCPQGGDTIVVISGEGLIQREEKIYIENGIYKENGRN